MDVRNCRNCGRLFNYLSGPNICPVCRDEAEKKFLQVKDYIRDNPRASVNEVAEENEVTTAQIQQWVREERLQFSAGVGGITCEKCGVAIETGRLCKKCKESLANALNDTLPKPKPEPPTADKKKGGDKMFHL